MLGKKRISYAFKLHEISFMLSILGHYKAALEYYQKNFKLTEQAVGNKHIKYAETLQNYGILLQKMGRCGEAFDHL